MKPIHYLSIDVEGAEINVLESINFNEIFIDIIGFENNYKESAEQIIDFLKVRGFIFSYRPALTALSNHCYN